MLRVLSRSLLFLSSCCASTGLDVNLDVRPQTSPMTSGKSAKKIPWKDYRRLNCVPNKNCSSKVGESTSQTRVSCTKHCLNSHRICIHVVSSTHPVQLLVGSLRNTLVLFTFCNWTRSIQQLLVPSNANSCLLNSISRRNGRSGFAL